MLLFALFESLLSLRVAYFSKRTNSRTRVSGGQLILDLISANTLPMEIAVLRNVLRLPPLCAMFRRAKSQFRMGHNGLADKLIRIR